VSVSYEKYWLWHNTCQRLRRKSWSFVVRRGYGGGRSACTHLSVSRACRLSGQRSSSGLDEVKTKRLCRKQSWASRRKAYSEKSCSISETNSTRKEAG